MKGLHVLPQHELNHLEDAMILPQYKLNCLEDVCFYHRSNSIAWRISSSHILLYPELSFTCNPNTAHCLQDRHSSRFVAMFIEVFFQCTIPGTFIHHALSLHQNPLIPSYFFVLYQHLVF